MTINDFPKEGLQRVLALAGSISAMTTDDLRIFAGHIPPHIQLITLLDEIKFLEVFDYNIWAKEVGWDYVMSPATLDNSDTETLRKLMTTHVRTNRFVEGHWDQLLLTGYISRFLARLQELYNEVYGQ
ncbi:DUF6508 domain-containing protein [Chitinophaga flava]|uniref:Uncharacterized protein n=1 Tax=Chitinophaga flava TaxID=2259036 RepID=A0A365XVY1_9BACT|nr:DUF6508 domain-containing protein [Chitinophaga flava]RBL90522.1 hypothetical protein DF182_29130 [Chitinophaga flava]